VQCDNLQNLCFLEGVLTYHFILLKNGLMHLQNLVITIAKLIVLSLFGMFVEVLLMPLTSHFK
jgi:hypothetical protein